MMLKTNLKIVMRVLSRNRWYSVTNIAGLAVGITAFLMTLLYETHLANYDAWDPGFSHLYQLRFVGKVGASYDSHQNLSPKMLPVLALQVPEIRASTRINLFNGGGLLQIGEKKFYEKYIVNADSSFFEVFPFKLKTGDQRTALSNLKSVVISEELADRYFGSMDPIGQHIRFNGSEDFVVTGVLAKPSGPTAVKINALMRIVVPDWAGWGNFQYVNYVKLAENANIQEVAGKMTHSFLQAAYEDMKVWEGWPSSLSGFLAKKGHDHLELIQISEVSLGEHKKELLILGFLSAIILIVACINFINQTVANADSRAREIGVRKVLGGMRGALARQFLLETFLQCLLALMFSFILVELLMPYYNKITEEEIVLLNYCRQPIFILKALLTLLGVTLLSGIYPAFFLSSFLPTRVLKGDFEQGSGGSLLRKLLLGLQFTFSVGFIISLAILSSQTSFMHHFQTGFNPAALTYITIQEPGTVHKFDRIKHQLLTIPQVRKVALGDYVPWIGGQNTNIVTFGDKDLLMQHIRVGADYFSTLGVKMAEGREFSSLYPSDTVSSIIINQAAVKTFNIQAPVVGKYLYHKYFRPDNTIVSYLIVGVVSDFMIQDFDEPIKPTAFLNDPSAATLIVLSIDPVNYDQTMRSVAEAWKEIEPDHPMVSSNLNDDLDKITANYSRLEKIVSLFAMVTITIAIIGLLALVAFNLKKRLKEICIRKVVGASIQDVLSVIASEFLWIIVVSNILAWLTAYLLMSRFLTFFAYHIPMPWFTYILVTLASIATTLAIISARVWKAIHAIPADILKYE